MKKDEKLVYNANITDTQDTETEKQVPENKNLNKRKSKKLKKQKKPAIQRWSRFLLVLSIIASVICMLPLFTTILSGVIIVLMVLIAMLTFFTLFLNEGFVEIFDGIGDIVEGSVKFIKYSPYILFAASGFMALSLLLTCLNKNKEGKTLAIVLKSIFLALMLVGAICMIIIMKNIEPA